MYVPKQFEESSIAVLQSLIRAHPLGAWVTRHEDELLVNHVPFLIDAERGENGTLVAHVARANPVWQVFPTSLPSVVIFQGPEAYISPSWYASKHIHGKVVPTWNYAVVHAHGLPSVIEDRNWLLRLLTRLTDEHESSQAHPWQVSDAPPAFINSLLDSIVGIEFPITRLVGKWKVSQNCPVNDRLGVIEGLQAKRNEASQAMADLVGRQMEGQA